MQYGKFNSAEELLKGYEELEKSFTQKCQRLSALEKQYGGTNADDASPQKDAKAEQSAVTGSNTVPAQAKPDVTLADSPPVSAQAVSAEQSAQYPAGPNKQACPLTDDGNRRIIYAPKVMTTGGNVSMALPNRPKTIKEASELAKQYFK